MPVYLVHGFRWPRASIRYHIILNNIDDAAPEYIVIPKTSEALLESFQEKWPEIMKPLPKLRFIEQYDPADTSNSATSQPFAFVADKVESCGLSLDVCEAMNEGVSKGGWDALMDLKDQLAPTEKLGWWVVYNGDELRLKAPSDGGGSVGGNDQVWDYKIVCHYSVLHWTDNCKEAGGGKKGNKLKKLLSR